MKIDKSKTIASEIVKKNIRITFCYLILILWVIFSPILLIFLKIKPCNQLLKKIFNSLNRFLLKSNTICESCGDHLNIDTNLKGWAKKKCCICKWMEEV